MMEKFQVLTLEKRLEASPQKDKAIALLNVVSPIFFMSNLIVELSLYSKLSFQRLR